MIKSLSSFPLILLLFFTSCSKDIVSEDDHVPTCEIKTDYYFSGKINGEQKCFDSGIQNYQKYVGTYTNYRDSLPPYGSFVIGIDTNPISVNDEHLHLYSPITNLEDPSEIPYKFPIRELTSKERSEFKLKFVQITGMEDGLVTETQWLDGIFDDDSTIEVISFEEFERSTSILYKVCIGFNCNLYNDNGELTGIIEDGELKGEISIFKLQIN